QYTEDPFTNGYKLKPFDRYDDWQHKTAFVDVTGEFALAGIDHQLLIGANYLDYYYLQRRDGGKQTITVLPGQGVAIPDYDYHKVVAGPASTYQYYGFYLQDLMTLNEHWKLLAGVRYDEQKKAGEGENSYALSPKFGVIYSPTDNGSVYVNYSKSFTPQGAVNNPADLNDGLDLKPEYGIQYEVGTKWELFNDRLLFTAAVFDITLENITVPEKLPNPVGDFTDITTQGGKQKHRGVEMGAQGQLAESWFVTSSMMYLDAKYHTGDEREGNTPVDAPKWSANIWTRYEMSDNLALNFGAIYVGERYADTANTITKDGYVRFDIGAAYTTDIMGKEVNLRANVKNLFDTDYIEGGQYNMVTLGQDRNFSLALEAKF
ncbi:MAG: TonB-dependent receptor, partial [Shewanella sp.]